MDQQIFLKMCNYCVYQERTHDEVRQKLKEYNIYEDEAEEQIASLIEENFVNEERYARAYAGGKFRVKKWGGLKILNELKRRKLSEYCIRAGMSEIDEEEYYLVLQALLHKKMQALILEKNEFVRKSKAASYALQKGYESDLIREILANGDFNANRQSNS